MKTPGDVRAIAPETDELDQGEHGFHAWRFLQSQTIAVETADSLDESLAAQRSPMVDWVLPFFRADSYDEAFSKARKALANGKGHLTQAALVNQQGAPTK